MKNKSRGPTRRDFIIAAAVLASYQGLGSTRVASAASKTADVIVVGAGISGLAAARELSRKGHSVIIVEARDRIGGRVWTDNSLGFPIDLGASWIQEARGNPITKLAREFGVKTVVDTDEWSFHEPNGKHVDSETEHELETGVGEMEAALAELAEGLTQDISIGTAVQRILADDPIAAEDRRYLNIFLATIEAASGADVNDQSLNYPLADTGFAGESLLFPNGYGQIAQGLAKGLTIEFDCAVSEIDHSGKQVKVKTSKGTFEAKRAVISVPLGALKANRIRFVPALPGSKQNAIKRLKMGLLNKIVLKFPKVFWPNEVAKFAYISEQKGEFPAVINWHKFSGNPALMSFVAGNFARQIEPLSDRDIVARQMSILRKIFGSSIPDPSGHVLSRWAADKHTGGCYSYAPVGATDADYDALAARVGPLAFAGEATIKEYSATVHGAYLSGQRAAKEIVRDLKQRRPG